MLVGVQPLVDIISLSLQSAFIKNEPNGVSLILISKPETAKTSTIFKFHNLDFVEYYDEITAKKLLDEFLPLVKNKQKRTLLIPDLINCLDKQRSTREQFLSLIKSGIDDTGIIKISTYHKQLYYTLVEGLRFNLITAITVDNFKTIKRYLIATGLLSRFLPFSYDYPISRIKEIFKHIEGEESGPYVRIPKIVKREIKVPDNPQLFKELEILAMKLGEQYKGYGIRALQQLKRLAKANAILHGRTEVTEEDISKIFELSKWINFEFNPL